MNNKNHDKALEKTRENVASLYHHIQDPSARISAVAVYIVAMQELSRARSWMTAILVGGFCLMLGLYIGLHIPR